MVLFGTGQYIQTTDVASTATQSLYGIRDNGAVVADRTDLVQQTVTEVQAAGGYHLSCGLEQCRRLHHQVRLVPGPAHCR